MKSSQLHPDSNQLLNNELQNIPPPELTIVLPCCNEAEVLPVFLKTLVTNIEKTGLSFEIIAVDDGSTDNTYKILSDLQSQYANLEILRFSRNFGHMPALTAGLDHARAAGAVITMDSDGQHPPELIPELVAHWQKGADIVQTVRRETAGASFSKNLTSGIFYLLLNKLGDTPVLPGAADFRLLSRPAVDALQQLPEKARFLRGLVFWIGYKMELIEFDAPPRLGGVTKYSFGKMLRFALDGITSFSTVLLRLSIFCGLLVVTTAMVYALYIVLIYIFKGSLLVSGWSSLMLTVLFLGGLNLIALGIIGEYIGRIYSEVKNRPLYILRNNEE